MRSLTDLLCSSSCEKEGFDVPVMIISAFISDQIKENLTPFDVQAFISKPFTIEDQKKQIERVLGPPANFRQEASASKGAGKPSPDLSEKLRAGHIKSIPLVGRGLAPLRPFKTIETEPVAPVAHDLVEHRRRKHRPSRNAPRIRLIQLSVISAICLSVTGFLAAMRWYADTQQFQDMNAMVKKAVKAQRDDNDRKAQPGGIAEEVK